MIEGIGAPQLQGASRPGGQTLQSSDQALGSAQITRGASSSNAEGVGASDAASDQAVEQTPRVASPGPENDFGQRGSLVDIAA
jgi:hypothetical protein